MIAAFGIYSERGSPFYTFELSFSVFNGLIILHNLVFLISIANPKVFIPSGPVLYINSALFIFNSELLKNNPNPVDKLFEF